MAARPFRKVFHNQRMAHPQQPFEVSRVPRKAAGDTKTVRSPGVFQQPARIPAPLTATVLRMLKALILPLAVLAALGSPTAAFGRDTQLPPAVSRVMTQVGIPSSSVSIHVRDAG